MLLISLIILVIFKLLLAHKDAQSYLLKDNDHPATLLEYKRIRRWHLDGVLMDMVLTGILAWATLLFWQVPLLSLLVRLSVFDLAFNKWSFIPIKHLGSTAIADKFFSKIFGANGAIKKSVFFLLLSIVLVIL